MSWHAHFAARQRCDFTGPVCAPAWQTNMWTRDGPCKLSWCVTLKFFLRSRILYKIKKGVPIGIGLILVFCLSQIDSNKQARLLTMLYWDSPAYCWNMSFWILWSIYETITKESAKIVKTLYRFQGALSPLQQIVSSVDLRTGLRIFWPWLPGSHGRRPL